MDNKDYDELWEKYSYPFVEKLDKKFDSDWSKLDETEQEIAALWKLEADVYMEGFDTFFLNWGYDCYSYAMRGIKRIADANDGLRKTEVDDVYKLLDNAYQKVFARFENDNRIKSYEDIVEYLNEKDEKILEETYDKFDEKLGPLLFERAYEYYCGKLNKQP